MAISIDGGQIYFSQLSAGVFAYAREHGPWRVVFTFLNASPIGKGGGRSDLDLSGMIVDSNFDIAAIRRAHRAAAAGLPVVDVSQRPRRAPRLPQVLPDNVEIGRMAGRHFRERGFRHFGYFGVPPAWGMIWSERRLSGFIESVGKASCSVYLSSAPAWGQLFDKTEQHRIRSWLASLPKPAGILACADWTGWHLLEICREQGIIVPEQVSLIGVDNDLALCETAEPPMSSVELGAPAIGYAAAKLLDQLMDAAEQGKPTAAPAETLVSPARVVARRSSDALAVENPEVARAMRIISERAAAGPLDVDMLLAEVAVSRRWLEKQFRHILGRTIREQIWHVRIARAKQLLVETDLPMPAVARKSGFGSAVQLSIVFKRIERERPTAFRTRHRSSMLRVSQ